MLTQRARYALHAMLFLAGREGSVTVAEIAAAERIPRKFLEQILAALKTRGLVIGKRGPTGGYVLGRAPAAISFADILRCIDGPLALAPCASQTAYSPCPDCTSVETCAIPPFCWRCEIPRRFCWRECLCKRRLAARVCPLSEALPETMARSAR